MRWEYWDPKSRTRIVSNVLCGSVFSSMSPLAAPLLVSLLAMMKNRNREIMAKKNRDQVISVLQQRVTAVRVRVNEGKFKGNLRLHYIDKAGPRN